MTQQELKARLKEICSNFSGKSGAVFAAYWCGVKTQEFFANNTKEINNYFDIMNKIVDPTIDELVNRLYDK